MRFVLFILFGALQLSALTTTSVFEKYPNRYFIETGCFHGDGIQMALDAGFENIYSIELSQQYYEHCKSRFSIFPNIHLIQGDSGKVLSSLLESIDAPATFWLDGHFCGGDTAIGDSRCPILMELEQIGQHSIKTHTILVDDVREFGTSRLDFIDIETVIAKIKEINPNYQISYENGWCENDVLVARVP